MIRKPIYFVILIPLLCLGLTVLYFLPPVNSRLAWRVDELKLRVAYAVNPPEKKVFTPQEMAQPAPAVTVVRGSPVTLAPPTPILPTEMPTPTVSPAPAELETALTPSPSATATVLPTPLPLAVTLDGMVYEDQHGRWNYCAPANLAMALTFWDWPGNRDVVGPVLKPVEKDKNVMPYEMSDYVNNQTGLRAALRVGGDLDLLKRFIAAGFPVLVEKGVYLRDISGVVSWMGHYQVVNGYDDASAEFITQDSYVKANHRVPYDEMIKGWRAFNYTYIVVYPPALEPQVMALLGSDADETTNFQNAALKASNEIFNLNGIDLYFAQFNLGSSLVKLEDYAGASTAYDEAFKIYRAIPESELPWRMIWYQTGPYFAYYHSGRYNDVVNLATTTLDAMQGEKNLEESYHWRAMARAKLGDTQGAVDDFLQALEYHPGFPPSQYELNALGVQ